MLGSSTNRLLLILGKLSGQRCGSKLGRSGLILIRESIEKWFQLFQLLFTLLRKSLNTCGKAGAIFAVVMVMGDTTVYCARAMYMVRSYM